MRIVSYLIILAISAVIGFSSLNCLDIINDKTEIPMQKEVSKLLSFTRTS